MDTPSTLARTESELRSQLEDWARAVRAKDVDRIFAHYAPDIVALMKGWPWVAIQSTVPLLIGTPGLSP